MNKRRRFKAKRRRLIPRWTQAEIDAIKAEAEEMFQWLNQVTGKRRDEARDSQPPQAIQPGRV